MSLTLRPLFDAFGAKAGFEFGFADGASSTRMVTSPARASLGAFSVLSKNRSLLGFFRATNSSSAGGVGGRATGSAFRISSGSKAGRARRRASCVVEPCSVAVLSDKRSSFGAEISLLLDDLACNFRRSSSLRRFSLFDSSSLLKMSELVAWKGCGGRGMGRTVA